MNPTERQVYPPSTSQNYTVDRFMPDLHNAPTPQYALPQQHLNEYMTSMNMPMDNKKPNEKPIPVDASNTNKQWDDMLTDLDELRNDFQVVKKMNLLDDVTILDDLFYKMKAFNNNSFFQTYIYNLYEEKYSELFKKYTSLQIYFLFALNVITLKSFSDFKNMCVLSQKVIKLPQIGSEKFTKTFCRTKRNVSTVNPDESELVVKKKSVQHPFLNTDIFKQKRILFEIGNCCDVAIPSDFAILFSKVQFGTVTKYAQATKTIYSGWQIKFSIPFVGLVLQKTAKNFPFYNIEHMDGYLAKKLIDMTGLQQYFESFSLGKRDGMSFVPLQNGQTAMKIEAFKNDTQEKHMVAVIDSYQLFAMSNKTFNCKTFSRYIYILNVVNLSEDALANCEEIIKNSKDECDKEFEKYDALLKKAV